MLPNHKGTWYDICRYYIIAYRIYTRGPQRPMPTLNFKGKTAIESYHLVVPHHILDFDEKLSLTDSPCLDGNLIIEGDNLLALKALLPTHAGKVKCIYIDPPYNTGNEGWIYNDNLTQPQFKEWIGQVVGKEGEDACRHEKWCCMMYPRLQLLKELLSDDGVIFVSIDEREIAHLLMLMDEVFLGNQLAVFVWSGRSGKGATTSNVEMTHEYVLAYAKNLKQVSIKPVETLREGGVYEDSRGRYDREHLRQWGQGDRREDRPSMHYPIPAPDGSEVYPKRPDGSEGRWRCSESSALDLLTDGGLDFVQEETGDWIVYRKIREGTKTISATDSMLLDVGSASTGTIEIKRIFGGEKVFPTVKPTALIKRLIDLVCFDDPNAVILDSFAGSGTTGHAVLELNKQQGTNHRFVIVQMPQESSEQQSSGYNLCVSVTAERIRRVVDGYIYNTRKREVSVEGLGGGFTYCRVGKMLFDRFRNFPKGEYPSYEELAKYIFYTETSRALDVAGINYDTGLIGENAGRSYYLLYTPDGNADRALTMDWLAKTSGRDPQPKVVYCEKIHVHRRDLAGYGNVRAMQVPFNLK
ncbi:MAG: site-specific DNA-methyltransferase [Armatimonadota bacterium]|nr:site-specific DNA-methyltransferase [Armatimonadota bacterium]